MQALVETSPGVWESKPIRAHTEGLFFVNPENLPKESESRLAYMGNAGAGFFAVVNGAPATPVDGSSLIKFDGFTNAPKKITTLSTMHGKADGTGGENFIIGWALVFNASTDAAAATSLNAALVALARYAPIPVQKNTDTSDVLIVPSLNDSPFRYRQDEVIDSIHVAPISVDATPVSNDFIIQLMLTP